MAELHSCCFAVVWCDMLTVSVRCSMLTGKKILDLATTVITEKIIADLVDDQVPFSLMNDPNSALVRFSLLPWKGGKEGRRKRIRTERRAGGECVSLAMACRCCQSDYSHELGLSDWGSILCTRLPPRPPPLFSGKADSMRGSMPYVVYEYFLAKFGVRSLADFYLLELIEGMKMFIDYNQRIK